MKTKNLFSGLLLSFLSVAYCFAQTPQSISYQAVARDVSGNIIANQNVSIRFSIRNLSAAGSILYTETHLATTNDFGLFNLKIGAGTPVTGTFSSINWSNGTKFLQIEIDLSGGSTYTLLGTQQLISVPYALFSASSETVSGIIPLANGGTNTNLSSGIATGDLLRGTSTGFTRLPSVATGNVLLSGGVGAAPSYGKVGLTTHVSGTLPLANGGTAATTATSARANLGAAASGINSDINSLTGLTTPLSVSQGGSGASSLSGYLKGNGGSAFTTVATIPAADISGNIPGNANGFTGSLTGDVTGTQSATQVTRINGSPLGTTVGATTGQILTYNGTQWIPSTATNVTDPVVSNSGSDNTGGAVPNGGCPGLSKTVILSGLPTSVPSNQISVTVNVIVAGALDLNMYLTAPNGSILKLMHYSGFGGGGSSLVNTVFSDLGASISTGTAPYTGTFLPSGSLSTTCSVTSNVVRFGDIGGGTVNPNGTWTLFISENGFVSSGATLNNWSVNIKSGNAANYFPKWNAAGSLSASSSIYDQGSYIKMDRGLRIPGVVNNDALINEEYSGSLFFWYSRKAALRTGYTSGINWLDANIGLYSVALGFDNLASGQSSVAFGQQSTASGSYSFAMGNSSDASGDNSVAMGSSSTASASNAVALGGNNASTGGSSIALGLNNTASATGSSTIGGSNNSSGSYSSSIGYSNTAQSFGEVATGTFNTSYTPVGTTTFNSADRIFVVGNGLSNAARSNALTILKNGNTAIGNINPTALLHVNGTAIIGTTGTTITNVIKATAGTTSVSIAANTTTVQTYTVANAATGSSVMVSPATAINAGLVIAYSRVSAANTIEVAYRNTTASAISLTAGINLFITVIQ
jgi:hypothetical protein